jgi:hypothetical protein
MGSPYAQDASMAAQGPVPAESAAGDNRAWQQHPNGGPGGGQAWQQRPARPERERADHGQAAQEASDPGKRQRGSDAEQAASARLRDAITHAEHTRAAYATAWAAERAAPEGSSARADAQAARLAAKEAQFYADLDPDRPCRGCPRWMRLGRCAVR